MLFKEEHRILILSGRTTQTRRLWQDERPMAKVGGLYWAQTRLFRNRTRFARIRVNGLDWMPLDPMPAEDVYAAGCDGLDAFKAAFMEINHMHWWPKLEMVWRVQFEVVHE